MLTDPARDYPVVVTTARDRIHGPFLDGDVLAAQVGGRVPVYVLDAHAAGQVSRKLPARLDVYGGATRVYTRWPGPGQGSPDERLHKLFLTYSEDEATGTTEEVVRFVLEHGLAWAVRDLPQRVVARPPRPAPKVPGVTPLVMARAAQSSSAASGDDEAGRPTATVTSLQGRPRRSGPGPVAPAVAGQTGRPVSLPDRSAELAQARDEIAAVRMELTQERAEHTATKEALALAMTQVEELEGQLREAERALRVAQGERNSAVNQMQQVRGELANATDGQRAAKAELSQANRTIRGLTARVEELQRAQHGRDVYPSDPERQFRHEVTTAWLHAMTEQDREDRPLPHRWLVGPDFLGSVDELDVVARDKIVRVVMEVLTGLVWDLPGRRPHQQRVSENGGNAQVVRQDGAAAWRCSLQTNTASARRLMWWAHPDGTIELGRVAIHDDTDLS